MALSVSCGIEGIPVIIRFKTKDVFFCNNIYFCIEGIPVIIRFKTNKGLDGTMGGFSVLKVFQL